MLREKRHVRQIKGEPRRRWFSDDFFDLIVWYDADDSIVGFQLCYQKTGDARALTWFRESGFRHERIDDGESRPAGHALTPVLVPDGVFDRDGILRQFRDASAEVDETVVQLVCEKLQGYQADGSHT